MTKYAYAAEPYWRSALQRQERQEARERLGRLDYDQLLNFGYEYIDARGAYFSRFRNMHITRNGTPEAWDASRRYDEASSALWDVARMVNVPSDIVVNAARVMNRYYARGCGRIVDAEKLIRSML